MLCKGLAVPSRPILARFHLEIVMALDVIAGRLMCLDVFRGLSPAQIERMAQDGERMLFRDGQKIIEAGEDGEGAIVLIAGGARILEDPESGIEERGIEPGSLLGETAMLAEHQFRITVVATGDVRAVRLARSVLRKQMEEDPGLADHFHARLANRLQRVAVELRLIDERLASASQMAATAATGR